MDLDARRSGDHRADPGDHPGAPLRAVRRHASRLSGIAERHGLKVIEDACQAHGARARWPAGGRWRGRWLLQLLSEQEPRRAWRRRHRRRPTTSRSPSASACCATTARTRTRLHVESGYCSRLHGLQAAFLRAKLPHLDEWNATRARRPRVYDEALARLPRRAADRRADGAEHVFHLYVVRVARPRRGAPAPGGARRPDRHPLRRAAASRAGVRRRSATGRATSRIAESGRERDRVAADVSVPHRAEIEHVARRDRGGGRMPELSREAAAETSPRRSPRSATPSGGVVCGSAAREARARPLRRARRARC